MEKGQMYIRENSTNYILLLFSKNILNGLLHSHYSYSKTKPLLEKITLLS
uniref:Uncharacterized protein n=1 Tax=Rhizophora mucronata TaxID=61149 RepID=A0A2P2QEI0_RHIMU